MDIFFCEKGVSTTRRYKVDDPKVCSHDIFLPPALPLNIKGDLKEWWESKLRRNDQPYCYYSATYGETTSTLSSALFRPLLC